MESRQEALLKRLERALDVKHISLDQIEGLLKTHVPRKFTENGWSLQPVTVADGFEVQTRSTQGASLLRFDDDGNPLIVSRRNAGNVTLVHTQRGLGTLHDRQYELKNEDECSVIWSDEILQLCGNVLGHIDGFLRLKQFVSSEQLNPHMGLIRNKSGTAYAIMGEACIHHYVQTAEGLESKRYSTDFHQKKNQRTELIAVSTTEVWYVLFTSHSDEYNGPAEDGKLFCNGECKEDICVNYILRPHNSRRVFVQLDDIAGKWVELLADCESFRLKQLIGNPPGAILDSDAFTINWNKEGGNPLSYCGVYLSKHPPITCMLFNDAAYSEDGCYNSKWWNAYVDESNTFKRVDMITAEDKKSLQFRYASGNDFAEKSPTLDEVYDIYTDGNVIRVLASYNGEPTLMERDWISK